MTATRTIRFDPTKLHLWEVSVRSRVSTRIVPIDLATPCIPWTGAVDGAGYGRLGKQIAHRRLWESDHGRLPRGYDLDHLCHNSDASCEGGRSCLHRRCINQAHLEPVPHRENILRGRGITAINAAKTHCAHGHEFTRADNRTDGKGRGCRTCDRARHRKHVA